MSGNDEKAKEIAKRDGLAEKNLYNYDNFEDVIDNADINIAYIVLPDSKHKEFTVRAAKAGKHVLREKPYGNLR